MRTRLLSCLLIIVIICFTVVSSFALPPSRPKPPLPTPTPAPTTPTPAPTTPTPVPTTPTPVPTTPTPVPTTPVPTTPIPTPTTPTPTPKINSVDTGKNKIKVKAGCVTLVKFKAPSSGTYIFTSTGTDDTVGFLYESPQSTEDVAWSDDENGDVNFTIEYLLNKNATIYLGVKYYSPEKSGTITVNISKKAAKKTSKTTKPTDKPTATPKWPIGRKCLVHDSHGNARKGPGTNNAVVGIVKAGETYEILDCKRGNTEKDWYKIKLSNNTVAWISSGIVDVDGYYFGTKNGEPIYHNQ